MERYSAITDVIALALSKSDTRPADIPPVQYVHRLRISTQSTTYATNMYMYGFCMHVVY